MPQEIPDASPVVELEKGLPVGGGMESIPEGIGVHSEAIQQELEMVCSGRPKRRASEGVAAAVGAVKARRPSVWEWFSSHRPTAAQRHAKKRGRKHQETGQRSQKRFKAPREENKAALEVVVRKKPWNQK